MKYLFVFFILIQGISLTAQNPMFSLSSENLNYVNPAFAGSSKDMKLGISYRNQWPGIAGNYTSTNVYFDKYLGKYGGLGIGYINDVSASTFKSDNIYLNYSCQFKIKEHGVLSLGAELGCISTSVDIAKMTFGSVNPGTGYIYPAMSLTGNTKNNTVDLGGGVVYYNQFFFASYGLHHINTPDVSLLNDGRYLPVYHDFYIGGKVKVSEKIALSPQLDVKLRNNFKVATVWLKADYKFLQLGIAYRNKDAVLYSIGIKNKHVRLFYCYDVVISKYSDQIMLTAGSHEITLQGMLGKKRNEREFQPF